MDPQAATIWANEIADPDLRAAALPTYLKFWKSEDPAAAAEWEAKRNTP